MSEIARRSTGTLATFDDKIRAAEMLAVADMIPPTYKKNPGNLFMVIEMGEALGIHHMVAIQEINIISGRPALSASLMASLARAAGHTVRVSGDAESATCEIVRADDPGFTHSATWDVEKARKAGLWGRGHWSKDAATMLKWRAVAECVRFACSEVLGGLKYTPEEILDVDGVDVIPNPGPGRPARDRAYGIRANLPRTPQAAAEAPQAAEDAPGDAEAAPEPLDARERRIREVVGLLHAHGYADAYARAGAVAGWAEATLGEHRPSLDALTDAELDRLAAELDGAPEAGGK